MGAERQREVRGRRGEPGGGERVFHPSWGRSCFSQFLFCSLWVFVVFYRLWRFSDRAEGCLLSFTFVVVVVVVVVFELPLFINQASDQKGHKNEHRIKAALFGFFG